MDRSAKSSEGSVRRDGYLYNGREIDLLPRLRQIAFRIPSLEHVVVTPYRKQMPDLDGVRKGTLVEVHRSAVAVVASRSTPPRDTRRLRRRATAHTPPGGNRILNQVSRGRQRASEEDFLSPHSRSNRPTRGRYIRAVSVRSSGLHHVLVRTTGLPKCMVHSAGEHSFSILKELILHTDLKREDCIFYYTTCGWMM